MRVHGHTAAIVGDGQQIAGLERHLNTIGMACNGFVHRVVEHFGGEVVQRPLVGAADVHARPAPDRLQALQDLNRMGIVIGGSGGGGRKQIGHRQGVAEGGGGVKGSCAVPLRLRLLNVRESPFTNIDGRAKKVGGGSLVGDRAAATDETRKTAGTR